MTTVFDAADALLASRGAHEIPHPGGTLLAHLRRVRELLGSWGAGDDIQLAGLTHAAYGTDGFAVALFELGERALLRDVIGETAESLVYCYGSCDRSPSYPRLADPEPTFTDRFTHAVYAPDSEQLQAFLEITAANELDVFRHNADLTARFYAPLRRLLAGNEARLSEGARAAWELS